MRFQFNDGGRAAEGFRHKKHCGDCVCRAIAIATQRPYSEIYDLILHYAEYERTGKRKRKISDPENGVGRYTHSRVMSLLGWEWVPTMGIGTGCKVHLCADELPAGRIVVNVSNHFTAVVDGVINDTYDPSRGGTRCVYGYYRPTANALKPSDPLPVKIVLHPLRRPKSLKFSAIDYTCYRSAEEPSRTHQERAASKGKAITPPDAQTLQKARRERIKALKKYDPDGWRIFTPAEMRRTVESLIPAELRPYYTGVEIDTEYAGPLTAANSAVYVYFRKPVCGPLSDTRYVHCRLYDLTQELDACCISAGLSEDDEYYADYDAEYGDRPVVPIKSDPVELNRDREALRQTWKRSGRTRAS